MGTPAVTVPSSGTWATWAARPGSRMVRLQLGSRSMQPIRSSLFKLYCTEEVELSPTASPISRTGGAPLVQGALNIAQNLLLHPADSVHVRDLPSVRFFLFIIKDSIAFGPCLVKQMC